ncbi:MAG: phosphate acyltransferase, partial [Albidovulum sp.]
MTVMQDILTLAAQNPKTIALSEGEDPRIVAAAIRAAKAGIARIILIGQEAAIQAQIKAQGGEGLAGITVM